VIAAEDVFPESIQVAPEREVDQDQRVAVGADRGRVPVLGLEAPHESGAPLGKGVDLRERGHEVGHDRLVGLPAGAGHVNLGEVKVGGGHDPKT
jgi:hypothetical protein